MHIFPYSNFGEMIKSLKLCTAKFHLHSRSAAYKSGGHISENVGKNKRLKA